MWLTCLYMARFTAKNIVLGVCVLALAGCGRGDIMPSSETVIRSTADAADYREYQIENHGENNDNIYIFEEALGKLQKQTKGKKIEQVKGKYGMDLPSVGSSFNLEQPLLAYFTLDNEEYWIIETGRTYVQKTGKDQVWWEAEDPNAAGVKFELYKNKQWYADVTNIFSNNLCWGIDGREGMVTDIAKVKGEVAFTYIIGDCASATSTLHVYMEKNTQTNIYEIEGSRYPFEYKGAAGFIAQIGGKEYVVVDGKIASPGYDRIYTNSCCAAPFPVFEIYDDGYAYFVGIRDGVHYIVEAHIPTFVSSVELKKK